MVRDMRDGYLFLSQNYLEKVLNRYGMSQAKRVSTPPSNQFKLSKTREPKTEEQERKILDIPHTNIVRSLMYSMVCTRPDMAYGLSIVSMFMSKPGATHWQAVKWLMRYIRGSVNRGIEYRKQTKHEDKLVGFVDSDYAGCLDSRKSISGYVFILYGVSYKLESLFTKSGGLIHYLRLSILQTQKL